MDGMKWRVRNLPIRAAKQRALCLTSLLVQDAVAMTREEDCREENEERKNDGGRNENFS
jgi:hypothetical protein